MSSGGFRSLYGPAGPAGFYRKHAADYHNPHEPVVDLAIEHLIHRWARPVCADGILLDRVLDLAAGGGEASLALLRHRPDCDLEAADPFTAALYLQRVGRPCQNWAFEEIGNGEVVLPVRDCILVSCALHLCPLSWLPVVCLALARATRDLVLLSPLTRPVLRHEWGFDLREAHVCSLGDHSLRLRWYRSFLVESQP